MGTKDCFVLLCDFPCRFESGVVLLVSQENNE